MKTLAAVVQVLVGAAATAALWGAVWTAWRDAARAFDRSLAGDGRTTPREEP